MFPKNIFFPRWLYINRKIDRFFTKALSFRRITPAQMDVLNLLADKKECSSKELQGELGLDSSSLTGLIQRIQKAGWVTKMKNQKDKRSILLFLTPEGKQIHKQGAHAVEELNRVFSSACSEEEWKNFYTVLRKIENEFLLL
jgi:MarR family transcriptional regulator, organic hydroperoxide resistance regulator